MTPLPLAGVRLVSLAQNLPGPVAVARLVADGATAIKVEPPAGDPLAAVCPAWYAELHTGIEVYRLDVKAAQGAERLRGFLADADVFVAGQRPSALARLGLDADTFAREFPALRSLNIVGDTADPEAAGHDLTYMARAGLLGRDLPATLFGDMAGAERAYAAVLMLLREPPGTRREVGLFDTLAALAAPVRHGLTVPGGLLCGGLPAYGVYDTREGRVAVAALEPHFRARLYEALGLPLDGPIAEILRERTAIEWERWAAERDIPLVAVKDRASPMAS